MHSPPMTGELGHDHAAQMPLSGKSGIPKGRGELRLSEDRQPAAHLSLARLVEAQQLLETAGSACARPSSTRVDRLDPSCGSVDEFPGRELDELVLG